MKTRTRRILILGGGWTLVLLGIISLFLPVLQGLLLLLAGTWLLSLESLWAARQRERLRAHPTTGPHMDRAETWIRGLYRRLTDRTARHRRTEDRNDDD